MPPPGRAASVTSNAETAGDRPPFAGDTETKGRRPTVMDGILEAGGTFEVTVEIATR
jgi:hypothetical protein